MMLFETSIFIISLHLSAMTERDELEVRLKTMYQPAAIFIKMAKKSASNLGCSFSSHFLSVLTGAVCPLAP